MTLRVARRHTLEPNTSLDINSTVSIPSSVHVSPYLCSCLDAGAYKFVCRVEPGCGKRFVRGDLLARHEERHQNRRNKQVTSDDGHSPPRNIAPSPTGSPTSELANTLSRSIVIPMSQSPDYDHGDYPGSDDGDRSGPLSSPDEMSLDGGYTYHSPTPNRQNFTQNYGGNHQHFASPLSTSPNNYGNSGFVPINQQQFTHNQASVLEQPQRGFPFPSEPVAIPQASAYSPPGNETNVFASFFTGQEGVYMDVNNPHAQGNGNWLDLYVPTALSWDGSNGGTWNETLDLQQTFSSQPAEVAFEARRESIYFPTVSLSACSLIKKKQGIPVGTLLSDGSGFQTAPIITQAVRDVIITQHLKVLNMIS